MSVANQDQQEPQGQEPQGQAPPSPETGDSAEPTTTVTGKPRPTFEERRAKAQRITEERRAESDPDAKPKPKGEAKPKGESKSPAKGKTEGKPEKAPGAPQDEPKGDAKGKTEGDAEEPAKRLERAAAALEKGDLKAVAAALGKGGKAVDDAAAKFSVMSRQRQRLTRRETALDQREAQLTQRESKQRESYGEPVAIREAYNSGQYHVVSRALERWCGDSFATITQKMARATGGLSKERLAELEERDRFEREKRQFEEERKAEQRRSAQTATRKQAHAGLSQKLEGHPVMSLAHDPDDPDLPDGAELVLRAIERHHSRYGEMPSNLRVVADQVWNRLQRRARSLAPQEPEPEPERPAPPPTRERRPRQEDAEESSSDARAYLYGDTSGRRRPSFEERHAAAARLRERRRA